MAWLLFITRELTRRPARTILTAVGVALGIGLVLVVTALARGIDSAQNQVLNPLGTLGSDLQATRPIELGAGGFLQLGKKERAILEAENGTETFSFEGLGDPGEAFERDSFLPATQLTFDQAAAKRIAKSSAVSAATAALTLVVLRQEGKVPAADVLADATRLGPAALNRLDITFDSYTAAGIDPDAPKGLGLSSPQNVTKGRFLRVGKPGRAEAVVSTAWAQRRGLKPGSTIRLADTRLRVVGVVAPALGQPSADIYLPLATLQEIANRAGRVNLVSVRAKGSDKVGAARSAIKREIDGAQVADAQATAARVSGSLLDASDLADRLGRSLVIVSLVAAIALTMLLTLTSVTRRSREFGTLRAIGWTKGQVIRQVLGETLVMSAVGGALGWIVAQAVAAGLRRWPITLDAESAGASVIGGLGDAAAATPFGLGAIEDVSRTITVGVSIDATLALWAVALALGAGALAGGAGALRAARMQPADAFRQVE